MAGYAVTFSVVDNATKNIDAINKRIAQMRAPVERMSRSINRFVDVSGLRKVAQGFDYIWKAAGSVLSMLTRIVPVLGTITGAATLAGMVKLVASYASWSQELVRTASGIGTTTQKLQQFEDATRLAGGNAEDMRNGLKSLFNTLADFKTGQGAFALTAQWANQLKINLRDANGQVRAADELFPELIQKLADMKNPADRAAASIALLGAGGDRLVESFRQSSKGGFAPYFQDIQRYKELTDDQKRSLQLFSEAQGRLGVGFDRLGQQISVMLAKHFTPMLNSFSEFVEKNTPAILDATQQVSTAFGELWTSIAGDVSGENAIKTIRDTIRDLITDLKWLVDKGNDLAAILNRLANIHSWKDLTAPIVPQSEGGAGTVVPSNGLPGPRLNPAVEDALGKFWDRIMKGPENIRPGYQRQSSSGGYLPGGATPASYGGGGGFQRVSYQPGSGAAAIGATSYTGEFWADMAQAVQKGFEDAFNHLRGMAGAATSTGAGGGGGGFTPVSYQPGGGGGYGPSGGGSGAPGQAAPPPPGPMNLPGGTVARGAAITDRLATDLGLSREQAAGITGNLQAESGLQAIQERNPIRGRGGFGWAQWTGPRRVAFEAYAKEHGLDPRSDEANYGFLKKELQSPEYAGMMKQLGALKGPGAARAAAALFERLFERPAVSNAGVRGANAERFAQAPRTPAAAPGADYKTLTQEQLTGETPPPRVTSQYAPPRVTPQSPPVTVPPPTQLNGAVDVSITHKNAPPNSAVTASGAGSVNVAPVRVEHQNMVDI